MYPKAFFASKKIDQRDGKCFVIMPFAQSFDEVYETIREALESPDLNLHCRRADELEGGGHIMEDVLKQIGEAEIVIADLTGRNPNVFYELGIAQMIKDVEKVILGGSRQASTGLHIERAFVVGRARLPSNLRSRVTLCVDISCDVSEWLCRNSCKCQPWAMRSGLVRSPADAG